jgi:hypothetical protein
MKSSVAQSQQSMKRHTGFAEERQFSISAGKASFYSANHWKLTRSITFGMSERDASIATVVIN